MDRTGALQRGRELFGVSDVRLNLSYWDGIWVVRRAGSVDDVGATVLAIDSESDAERTYPGWEPPVVAAQFRIDMLTGLVRR